MSATAADYAHMAAAMRLARKGLYTTDPNPRVGCIITDAAGAVLASGWHERAGQPHAEARALAALQSKPELQSAAHTAYVTLEPCSHQGRTPPCADALLAAGIKRVVYALDDPNPLVAGQGAAKLRAGGVEVISGVQAEESAELNRGFVSRMQRERPWVTVKLAVSLDGRTALANGESQWITGPAARADVHRWRARSSAVLTGSGTVLQDNPRLNARLPDRAPGSILQPTRVVADSQLRVAPAAELFRVPGRIVVAHSRGAAAAVDALEEHGVQVLKLPQNESGHVDLHELMQVLAADGCNEILVEAGARLNGALLAANLVDEIVVYQASSILGDSARGMFGLEPLSQMQQRREATLIDVQRFGEDVRLRYSLQD